MNSPLNSTFKGPRISVKQNVSTTPFALTDKNEEINVDATSGAITINLPAISAALGLPFTIRKIDSSANTVTVVANSPDLIEGASSVVLVSQWQATNLTNDGVNWYKGAGGSTLTVGAFGSSPDVKGLTIVGSTLTAQPADATHPGMVGIAAQTFAGVKTLNDGAFIGPSGNTTGLIDFWNGRQLAKPNTTDLTISSGNFGLTVPVERIRVSGNLNAGVLSGMVQIVNAALLVNKNTHDGSNALQVSGTAIVSSTISSGDGSFAFQALEGSRYSLNGSLFSCYIKADVTSHGIFYVSTGANSGTNTAHQFNTTNTLSGATLLADFQNLGASKFSISNSGAAKANNFVNGFATTATAAGTTTLTVSSAGVQQFTGSTTQTVVLPDATTLTIGYAFQIINRSSGTVTVNANGGSLVLAVPGGNVVLFTVTNISTSAGVWDAALTTGTGSGGFTALTGDVTASGTGSVPATVALVGGLAAASVASGATAANNASTTASANIISKWDSSVNLQANSFLTNFATTATAAGTTTLTVSSAQQQQFTGSTTQTVVLPSATTLRAGQTFRIINRSSGTVTVNKNGGSLVLAVTSGNDVLFTVTDISTSAGVWDAALPAGGGGGSITGSGSAGGLAYWTSSSALSFDSLLNWDATNHRLSLGTAGSPSYQLWINSPNNNDGIKIIVPNNNGANAQLVFSAGSEPAFGQGSIIQLNSAASVSDTNAFILFNRTNGATIFGTNNAEVARFLANGKLLINRTTDDGTAAQLQVNGNTNIAGLATITTSTGNIPLTVTNVDGSGSNGQLTLNNTGGSNALSAMAFQLSGAQKAALIAFGSTSFGLVNGMSVTVATGGAFGVRVNSTNVLTADGTGLAVPLVNINGAGTTFKWQVVTGGSCKAYASPAASNAAACLVTDNPSGKVNSIYAGSGDCGVLFDSTSAYYWLADTASAIRAGTAGSTPTIMMGLTTNKNLLVGGSSTDNGQKLQVGGNFTFTARHAVADANYTVTTSDYVVAYTSISAARTVTLPSAATGNNGQEISVMDESGSCSVINTITVSTVSGGNIVLTSANAFCRVRSNGTAWFRIG